MHTRSEIIIKEAKYSVAQNNKHLNTDLEIISSLLKAKAMIIL